MTRIKTLLMAAAISIGVVVAMPAASQAMPQSAPVKVQSAKDSSLVEVRHKKWRKNKWRESRRWRHNRRWARYCDPWDGCYRRHRHARYRYWRDPYYGYGDPYYGFYGPGYYGYGGPGFYGPGIGLYFRIN